MYLVDYLGGNLRLLTMAITAQMMRYACMHALLDIQHTESLCNQVLDKCVRQTGLVVVELSLPWHVGI